MTFKSITIGLAIAAMGGLMAMTPSSTVNAAEWKPAGPITVLIGFSAGGGTDTQARLIAAVRQMAWPWVESGQVRPPINATFPLADAGLAHLRLEAGEHIGKIVLVVD